MRGVGVIPPAAGRIRTPARKCKGQARERYAYADGLSISIRMLGRQLDAVESLSAESAPSQVI